MGAKVDVNLTCECCKKEERVQVPVIFSLRGKGTFRSDELPGDWRLVTVYQPGARNDTMEKVVVCSLDCSNKIR